MKPELLNGLDAAASGARLSRVELVPNFPMPVTHRITDKLQDWVLDFESQSSVITAAIAATACEKRSFFAVNGLNVCQEFCNAALMRMPVVAAGNADLRDCGWLVFMPASNQEILDSVIQAYRVCEDNNVLLPGFVYIDFPELREPVIVPKENAVKGFLPNLRLQNKIDVKNPLALGASDADYETKAQQQRAMGNALKLMHKIDENWKKKFKRSYGLVEQYYLEDADTAIVIAGADALTAKVVVDRLREQGEKVGLLRLRVIRPLPVDEIAEALKDVKHIAVIDKDVSIVSSGILLYRDIKEFLPACSSVIAGRLCENDFVEIFKEIKGVNKPERFWLV